MNRSRQLFIIFLVSVHVILCYSKTILSSNASLVTSDSNRSSARYKRQSECPCLDAYNEPCFANRVCYCNDVRDSENEKYLCEAESDFCLYKKHFGSWHAKQWGTTTCTCPYGSKNECSDDDEADLRDPVILFDTEPEVGELQHVYVFLYDVTEDEPSTYQIHFKIHGLLTFKVDKEFFHTTYYADALMYNLKTGGASSASVEEHKYYSAFWYHFVFPDASKFQTTIELSSESSSSERVYTVYPKRSPEKCVPTVSIVNCAKDNVKPATWYKDTVYKLTSQVGSCPKSKLSGVLRLAGLGYSRDEPPFPVFFVVENLNKWKWDYPDNWYKKITTGSSATTELDTIDLKFGLNAASLEVVETPDAKTGKKPGKSVVTCYFNLKPGKVKPTIDGGGALTFFRGDDVELDGSTSYNPNVKKHTDTSTMVYSWSCWDKVTPKDTSVCKGKGRQVSKDAVYISKLKLVEFRTFVFQLEVYDKRLGSYQTLNQTVTDVKVVFYEARTSVDLTFCVEVCGCTKNKAHPDETVYLQASCLENCPSNLSYAWSMKPWMVLEGNTVFEPSDKLVIKTNVLKEGQEYNVMVTGGMGGVANHTITMNSNPTAGMCDVTPRSGNVDDLYKVTCTGFKDEDEDMSLTYSVYQVDSEDPEVKYLTAVKTVGHPWTLEISGLQLMEGGQKKQNQATLVVKAKDYYGSYALVTIQVEVNPPSEGWTIGSVLPIFDKYESGKKTKGDKIQMVFALTDGLSKISAQGDNEVNNLALFKRNMKKIFLNELNDINIKDGTDLVQLTDALHAIMSKNNKVPLYHENAKIASNITLNLAKFLQEVADNGLKYGCMSKEEIKEMSKSLVHTSTSIIVGVSTPDPDQAQPHKDNEDDEYPDYTGFDSDIIERDNNFNLASKYAMNALDILGGVFSTNQADSPGDNTIVADSITIWTKTGRPCDLAGSERRRDRERFAGTWECDSKL